MVSNKLRVVSRWLAEILNLYRRQERKKWVCDHRFLFLWSYCNRKLVRSSFQSQSCFQRTEWVILVPWDTGCAMSTQCTSDWNDSRSQDAWEIQHARLKHWKTPLAVPFEMNYFSVEDSLSEDYTQRYQSIIEFVMYAMSETRPDLVLDLIELSK
jgi:hypothetical protein